jgi:hypothetical protein
MATLQVSQLITNVSTLLQDVTNIRWPQTELLAWLNDGQREVAVYKPNAFTKNVSLQLVAGTKQTVPADTISLVDVVRNLGTSGTTPGRAIRTVSREILDAQTPYWHSATPAAEVIHFTYNPLDLKHFYVYPPQPASGQNQVEVIYLASPTDATLTSTITLDDIYITALTDYVLYRAYSKDAEYAANTTLAAAYYQNFMSIVQGKATAETISNPNLSLGAFNPNVPGSNK